MQVLAPWWLYLLQGNGYFGCSNLVGAIAFPRLLSLGCRAAMKLVVNDNEQCMREHD